MQKNDKSKRTSNSPRKSTQRIYTASHVSGDNTIVELVYNPEKHTTSYIVAKDGDWRESAEFSLSSGITYVPYAPSNNLIKHNVVLFPTTAEEYGSTTALVDDIKSFILTYVDMSPEFLNVVVYYILFTWVFDSFNELPYVRVRGDYGCGKTRFLIIAGSLCYKPIFASGASTVSPIFHILDSFGGTLILDEADFRFSDQTAELTKILNNGNVRGFPVLRSDVSLSKTFNPRAYNVYSPKMVATRGSYTDQALESRFITTDMGATSLRTDIPLNLPDSYRMEATRLRNKLLMYRIRNLHNVRELIPPLDQSVEPRIAQIFTPLLSVVDDPSMQAQLRTLASRYDTELKTDRSAHVEAHVLDVIHHLLAGENTASLSMKVIAEQFEEHFGDEYDWRITPKWIGGIVRQHLRLRTCKRNGIFVIAPSEKPKLTALFVRYGITSGDFGDIRDVEMPPEK